MVVRVFDSKKDNSFGAVNYNDEKVDKNKAVLLSAKNFPEYVDIGDSEKVKNFFENIESNNRKFTNYQFHAMISCKGKEFDDETLKRVGEEFMKNLGYNEQPFLIIKHNDTKNNHIHIVSTNVNIQTGMSMDLKFQKLKSQIALREAEKNILGIDYDKKLESLLNYNFSNENQLKKLLNRNGYDFYLKDNSYYFLKNGAEIKSVLKNEINFNNEIDKQRAKQISAILEKYKSEIDNNVFAISERNKIIDYHSLLQRELKTKFGIDILFSFSENKNPFGFILIDNKTKSIFKGSDVADIKNIFNFTPTKIEKSVFELLENSNLKSEQSKQAMKFYLENKFNFIVPDYLLNFGKKISYTVFNENRNTVKGFANGSVPSINEFKDVFTTIKSGENIYLVNERDNFLIDSKEFLNDFQYSKFENQMENVFNVEFGNDKKGNDSNSIGDFSTASQDFNFGNTIANQMQQISNALGSSGQGSDATNGHKQQKRRKKFRR